MHVFRPRRQLPRLLARKEYLLGDEIENIKNDSTTSEIQEVLNSASNNTITTQQTENIPVTHLNKNALHFACLEENPNIKLILNLLENGYTYYKKMNFGYSALSLAALIGNEELVEQLLASKRRYIDPHIITTFYRSNLISDSGFCPITIALMENNLSVAFKILKHFEGVDYKYLAFRETTIVHLLCATKCTNNTSEDIFNKLQIKIANIVTKYGMDLSFAKKHSTQHKGAGILNLCVTYDNYRLMKYFLKLGVGKETNKVLKDGGFSPLLYTLCQRDMNMFNRSGSIDRKRYFYKLLQYDFDVNVKYIQRTRRRPYYITPLFVALQTQQSSLQLDIIKVLLAKGSQILTEATHYVGHPFSYAIINSLHPVLEVFFEYIENNIIKQKLEEIPLAYVEKKLNYKVLDLFTPKPGLSNKEVLDVLLRFGLSEVYSQRRISSLVAFSSYRSSELLLYFEYLIKNVEDVNTNRPGVPPRVVSYALSGSCGLPLVKAALNKKFNLNNRALIRACASKTPHRIYRWKYLNLARAYGYTKNSGVTFVCDFCHRKIHENEYINECNDNKLNKDKCNICLCDDCSFHPGFENGLSCEDIVMRIKGAEKFRIGRKLHEEGKTYKIEIYADAGLVDENAFRSALHQEIYL
eukprot:snap_masked-scaffold_6-processed-gene-8.40-mRNA-1 protein AED:1.00 eAED:1.00 QI:0/0/0/0/1/1/2/0/638